MVTSILSYHIPSRFPPFLKKIFNLPQEIALQELTTTESKYHTNPFLFVNMFIYVLLWSNIHAVQKQLNDIVFSFVLLCFFFNKKATSIYTLALLWVKSKKLQGMQCFLECPSYKKANCYRNHWIQLIRSLEKDMI